MITGSVAVTDDVLLRPATPGDAAALSRSYLRNRDHLQPWEPRRPEEFYTARGQADWLRAQLQQQRQGRLMPWLLTDGDRVVGAVTLSNIALGPFRSANLGYWVDAEYTGRGIATTAVRLAYRAADEQLGLHRVQAGTVVDNQPSQRVLSKCGFELIGAARNYLHINGAWRDHLLFQRVLHDRRPPT
ncbi:GNAT family N-acetyltransferase [Streptomyces sp. H27-D2]|uniref:GNAT family N-acetyltransferase n=1 Tax=Streptomyces sp. H27-D2 TaxID=3046304 RepID=UPI002DB8AFD3|nr:GNAT family protein [Streptomyces sp. H27-D2]MEC4015947.1 GNAT family protein [Streptomyces sp. H27-D2]